MRVKDIRGYEGLYVITDSGAIISLNYRRTGKSKELKQMTDKQGYKKVSLGKEGKLTQFFVHRLVAEHFLENPHDLPQVNHIDEDKSNNTVNNLEWCTSSYNVNFGTRNLRDKLKQGKKVVCIENGTVYPSIREASKCLGLDRSDISKCCRGVRNIQSVKGYHFMFKEDDLYE